MNRQSKSAIKSLVLTLRHKLEDDIGIQLKRYGFAGERWLELERLPHIQRDDQATIDHFRLKAALEQHLRRIGADPTKATPQQRAEAVDWFVREVAFTHLNRLVALKCLEVRDLIPEIITTRDAYGGRSRAHYDYRNAHPDEARRPDDALPAAVRHVCRQVYAEFKFLFDVGDPATNYPPPTNAILWPDYPVLKECITLINNLDHNAGQSPNLQSPISNLQSPSTLWAEDEILGWIYQFYNAEQKEAIRKRGRPRRPAEVAVINQFFTPRWIVKFLVDNTLGRLWLEMHPDSERVRAKCDYLVPEPLGTDDTRGQGDQETRRWGEGAFRLDPDSPINDPKAPPRREPKCPQDIRLIDPACGTMHFGHYAFEVFQEIYRDANDHGWHDFPSPSQGEGLGVRVGEGDIPVAILRYNLYGVDIDLRAVQLAGLSLFIKAKSANPRAHISHVNLVVADAVLPADGARQRFLDQYRDDKVVQDAVRQVLDEMANVAEVGSLLRVEERLREILGKAGHAAVQDLDAERQRELPGFEPPVRQLSLAETAGAVPEEWGAHYTLARLLDDLRAFAADALQTHDLNAQLFAEEAEKTVHLLDVFLNEYDVVVMNPPYGDTTGNAKPYLSRAYPSSKNDLYAVFIDRGLDLLYERGLLGAFVSRTFLFESRFEKFRREVLLGRSSLSCLAEIGLGALDDATVRPAALVLRTNEEAGERETESVFFRVTQFDPDARRNALEKAIRAIASNRVKPVDSGTIFRHSLSEFGQLPSMSFAYWGSQSILHKFVELPPLDRDNVKGRDQALKITDVKEGLGTRDDMRFVRYHWEVPDQTRVLEQRWFPFHKGGRCIGYYKNVDLVVDWENDGEAIKENIVNKYPYLDGNYSWLVKNTDYYFHAGIAYTRMSEKPSLGAYYLPVGCIFADVGPVIFVEDDGWIWDLLAVLNSSLIGGLIKLLTPSRNRPMGLVSSLPIPVPSEIKKGNLAEISEIVHRIKATWDTGNETCTRFDAPWLVQAHRSTLLAGTTADGRPLITELDASNLQSLISNLQSLLNYVRAVETAADARLQGLQAQIDEAVYDLYEISKEDRALVERELGDRPPELVWPQMERKSDEEKRCEHVRRLISYFLLQALKEKRDGILPLIPGTGQPTGLDEVRRGLEAEFGEAAAFRMEPEIKKVLGRDIETWLDRDFFKWHVRLYKRRPVVWHLASPSNSFACFLHIHKLDQDTLRKVQTLYLWPRRRAAEAELASAKAENNARRIEQAETILDDLAEFEKRLLSVIQAQVECDIPDWAEGPFRNGVYDPVLDDGVKVNIIPLQEAGVLRYRKVV